MCYITLIVVLFKNRTNIQHSRRCMGSGDKSPSFFISSLEVGELSRFTPRPPYFPRSSLRYVLDRMLGGTQYQYGRCRAEKNLLPLLGNELLSSSPEPVFIPTELFRLIKRHLALKKFVSLK